MNKPCSITATASIRAEPDCVEHFNRRPVNTYGYQQKANRCFGGFIA